MVDNNNKVDTMKKELITSLLDKGFNCIPLKEDKTPLFKWKDYQDQRIDKSKVFSSKSSYFGLVCGYNDVEAIDIDLKVLPSKKEREVFAKELFQMIDDHVDDFDKRFVVKRTRSNGYHIIYRAGNIEGNLKLATLEGYTEAIIETRGIGGYICMYPDVRNMDYLDIQPIADEEREIIIGICRSFNQVHNKVVTVDTKTVNSYTSDSQTITPWDDYNRRNKLIDVVSDEFDIVGQKGDKTLIRRHGAKSPHSGYIFNSNDCMYLFSTGTIYESQTLISAFHAYSIKHHNGDFSKAASVLYSQGYGDRRRPRLDEKIVIKPQKNSSKATFPKDIFPDEINHYMTECQQTLNNSIDYLGCSFLWLASLVIGNSIRIEVKKGWYEISTIWLAIVGEPGIGKTPSIDSILRPLDRLNGEEKKRYQRARDDYESYQELGKDEKKLISPPEKPQRTQFIVDDVTIEALINLHSQNPNGVGVHKDELAGWFKDMNKYKEGSDKEQWLSSWSGKGISVDRITRQSDYIARPILPVLGGIQPSILSGFYISENVDNGFMDRMLFAYPELTIDEYNENEISSELIDYYDNWVRLFHQEMRKIVQYNDFGDVEPHVAKWSEDARKQWVVYFNEITKAQNSDKTNEFLKSVLPKMKSYLPRFALIINTIEALHEQENFLEITKDSLIKAYKLVKYFIYMNEKITLINSDVSETQLIMNSKKGLSGYEKLKLLIDSGKDFSKSQVAKELNISRQMLYKYIKKLENGTKGLPRGK